MSAKTLLSYDQDILSALDSDEVQSISDTVESLQVARIINRAYDAIVLRADLSEHYTLFQLDASGDNDQPVVMYRLDDISTIEWIKYDKQTADNTNTDFKEVTFLPLDEFLNRMYMLSEDDDTVDTFTLIASPWMTTGATDTVTIMCKNNAAPTYYTCYDDYTLIFDSYDSEVDTTLQNNKTLAYGKKEQIFTLSDAFVPFIDREFQTLLLNEAMVLAFAELKQVPHEIAVKWANRAWTKASSSKRGVDSKRHALADQVNYGRK